MLYCTLKSYNHYHHLIIILTLFPVALRSAGPIFTAVPRYGLNIIIFDVIGAIWSPQPKGLQLISMLEQKTICLRAPTFTTWTGHPGPTTDVLLKQGTSDNYLFKAHISSKILCALGSNPRPAWHFVNFITYYHYSEIIYCLFSLR